MDPIEAQEALDQLAEAIHRLKIDFDRFFIGALPTPPESLRFKTFARMRQLRSQHHKSASIRFKVNSLEAKLNSLNELFNRRLREHEMGTRPRAAAGAPIARKHDPYSGVVIGSQGGREAAEALYAELYGKEGRKAQTDFDSFQDFIAKQAKQIRDKTGCSDVVFRVTSQRGKLTLKAKASEEPPT